MSINKFIADGQVSHWIAPYPHIQCIVNRSQHKVNHSYVEVTKIANIKQTFFAEKFDALKKISANTSVLDGTDGCLNLELR